MCENSTFARSRLSSISKSSSMKSSIYSLLLRSLYVLWGGIFLLSCSPKSDTEEAPDKVLAVVGRHKLYASRVPTLPLQAVDSSNYVQKYVRNWILEELIMKYAEEVFYVSTAELEERIRNYRKILVQYTLEQQYVEEQLNPTIKEDEIVRYYQQHAAHFTLNESILRLLYVKIPRRASGLAAFRAELQHRPLGGSSVRGYCSQNPKFCILSDKKWMSLEKVLRSLPVARRSSIRPRLTQEHYIEVPESTYIHLFRVLDYRVSGMSPPIDYIREEIIHNILSKRKKELIKTLHEDIWKKGERAHAYEIHL